MGKIELQLQGNYENLKILNLWVQFTYFWGHLVNFPFWILRRCGCGWLSNIEIFSPALMCLLPDRASHLSTPDTFKYQNSICSTSSPSLEATHVLWYSISQQDPTVPSYDSQEAIDLIWPSQMLTTQLKLWHVITFFINRLPIVIRDTHLTSD